MYQKPGCPRIALLNSSGAKLQTSYLPMCDKGFPAYTPVAQEQVKRLVTGSKANRRLGWIPQLTMRWSVYIDQIQASFTEGVTVGPFGYVVGSGNNQMPSMADLLALLSNPPGYLEVSPGPLAGGFVAQSWTVKEIGVNPLGQAQGVEIMFEGGTIMSSMTLGAW